MLPEMKQPWFQFHRPQYHGNQIWFWRGVIAGLMIMVTILWPAAAGYAFSPPTAPHYQAGAFPRGPADDNTRSIGTFRIYVAPKFRPLLAGYPGYDSTTFRLQSPLVYDPATKIGRSDPHSDGDAADNGGTVVGTALTLIRDSDFSLVPSGGFNEGPVGTHEVHTEVRELNMMPIGPAHPNCPGIPGTVAVRAGIDAPAQPISPGEVESLNTGADFPAESFFNVFAEVDLPGLASFPGGTLYNADPLLVINSNLTAFPPQVIYIHANTNAVPMLFRTADPGGAWAADEVFGWLVLAGHGINLDCNNTADVETFQTVMAAQVEMPLPAPAADSFPGGPADDNTRSLGMFRLFVAEPFRPLMAGYPGYDNATARLHSPFLYDPNTKIGRSDVHTDGDTTDGGGTPVGTAGTMIADGDFSLVPSGDFNEGPAGTREVHTEVRELNMTPIGLTHPNCPGIPGSVAVRAGIDAPAQPFSPGEVESLNTGTDFPAESFFNVFAEVDMPPFAGFAGGTLYNADPLLVINNNLNAFPPQVVYVHANTNAVPMLFRTADPGGAWAANDLFGWLVLAGHGINFDCEKNEDVAQFRAVVDKLPELPLPNHFRCYDVLQEGPVDVTVGLRDQFGSEEVRVREPFVFCNPVEKRHNNQVTPINDPDAHLKFYHIATQNQDPPRAVLVSNQFGEAQKLRVEKPLYLAVPTQKLSPQQHEFPKTLDHYKCYQASGNAVEATVGLRDQFYTDDQVRVLDPVAFCNPTEKRHGDIVTPITYPKEHLTCYSLEGPTHADLSVTTVNQFGDAGFVVRDSNLLCVPSTKDKVIEVDDFGTTRALVGVRLPNGSLINVVLSGPATAEVALSSLGDSDTDGLEEVTTELVQMELQGSSPLGTIILRGGAAIGLAASPGQIEEAVNVQSDRLDLPGPHLPFCTPPVPANCQGTRAASYFDVLFELEVPGFGKLHNRDPLRLETMIYEKPPKTTYKHVITNPIELFNENNQRTGLFLVTAQHATVPIEVDEFQHTIAVLELDTPQGRQFVRMRGPTTVNILIDDSTGAAQDTDNDGLEQVETEMVQLDLRGWSSFGVVALQLNEAKRSAGVLEERTNNTQGILDVAPFAETGVADSFFDIFVEIRVGDRLLHNETPVHMQSTLTRKVPQPLEIFQSAADAQPIELVDTNGQATGIRIVRVIHWPNPPIIIPPVVRTRAQFTLQTSQGKETITLAGPVTVNLFLDATCTAHDNDGDGLDEVPTEIVVMSLTGNSSTLGNVTMRLHSNSPSSGQLEEKNNATPGKLDLPPCTTQGTADSFFDIFVELEIPTDASAAGVNVGQSQVLHAATPIHLETTVSNQNPLAGKTYTATFSTPVELLDENGNSSGIMLVDGVDLVGTEGLYLPLIHK